MPIMDDGAQIPVMEMCMEFKLYSSVSVEFFMCCICCGLLRGGTYAFARLCEQISSQNMTLQGFVSMEIVFSSAVSLLCLSTNI